MTKEGKQNNVKKPVKLWFKRNFITGLVILVPIMGTLFLFVWGFNKITDWGLNLLLKWSYFKTLYEANKVPYDIIGRLMVIFGMLILVFFVGFLTRNLFGRWILRLTEKIFANLPIVNRIFSALKQISKTFVTSGKHLFAYVVLFEYPRKGIYSIGFVMSESFPEVEEITGKEVLNVFLLTTPNPTTGFTMTIPKEETIRLSMSVEEGLQLVISGGAVVPEHKSRELIEQNSSLSSTQDAKTSDEDLET